ncbi:MAG: NUDIX hydrolase [Limnohabitans sp.]|nr:MAG: NUDIX hydrolase [Limnohabitans sp.]
MEQNNEIITTPPVDAASVLLLRDSDQGLQVLLLRRHQASQVLGGAYVFPGGKLDAEDHAPEVLQSLSEAPEHLRQRLHEAAIEPARAAGLFMAALREAFEECGVLAGQDHAGPALAAQLRKQMAQGSWHQSLREGQLQLRTDLLLPWSRWITPRQPSVTNKRFDTRFFLASVVDDQVASHDNFETTDSVWLTPLQALSRYAAGEIDLIAPQIMSLYQLKMHRTVHEALQEARQRPPALVEPHPFDLDGQRILCYPGDPQHPVASRAMRGPTRLLLVRGRFVPQSGMTELLD